MTETKTTALPQELSEGARITIALLFYPTVEIFHNQSFGALAEQSGLPEETISELLFRSRRISGEMPELDRTQDRDIQWWVSALDVVCQSSALSGAKDKNTGSASPVFLKHQAARTEASSGQKGEDKVVPIRAEDSAPDSIDLSGPVHLRFRLSEVLETLRTTLEYPQLPYALRVILTDLQGATQDLDVASKNSGEPISDPRLVALVMFIKQQTLVQSVLSQDGLSPLAERLGHATESTMLGSIGNILYAEELNRLPLTPLAG